MKLENMNVVKSPRIHDKRWAGLLRTVGVGTAGSALIASLQLLNHPWHSPIITFVLVMGVWFFCELYWALAPAIEHFFIVRIKRWNKKIAARYSLEQAESNLYTPKNVAYKKRRLLRILIQIGMILTSWWMMYDLSLKVFPSTHTISLPEASNGYLAMGFFLFSLIFIAWIGVGSMGHYGLASNRFLWMMVGVFSGVCTWIIFVGLREGGSLGILMFLFGFSVTGVVYITERIEVGDRVWTEVIRSLIIQLLSDEQDKLDWKKVARQIGSRMGYERVFILLPCDEGKCLRIVAEFGDYPKVTDMIIPLGRGITGVAYATGKICASNDVSQLGYYERLIAPEIDNTRSEIAAPLHYRGETLGILDVQSRHTLVYGPSDIHTIEMLARILSLALAIKSTDRLMEKGRVLWENISKSIYNETEILQTVSEFTQKELQADLVVFYRLTPSGVPNGTPNILGKLHVEDTIPAGQDDLTNPLAELIKAWEPYYEENVVPGSKFQPGGKGEGFAGREGVRSAFFIPIGTPDERLAAVFLNYRHHRSFNNLFRMMVMGFAQAFAAVMARERYRDLLFQGVGRPDLGVHNILARYGLKDGMGQEMQKIISSEEVKLNEDAQEKLTRLSSLVDDCLIELRAQSAQIDSSWNHSLTEAVDTLTRKMKDHVPGKRAVRFSKELDPLVERETAWTRLAIFRLIDEAVNNAIYHGNATEIQIKVTRGERNILVLVVNNGDNLPDDADRLKSRRGIFSVMEELEEIFQARFSIEKRKNQSGTIVKVVIPTLPIPERASKSI